MQLTQKETELLNDLKSMERLCIDKYKKHATAACDQQLKNLFNSFADNEQAHLNVLDQISSGSVPQYAAGGGQMKTFTATYGATNDQCKLNDQYLCSDLLSSEKHASNLYDTCVFEFKDENVRKIFNTIQGQEQNHGKMIYDYMATNSMYS